MPTPPRRSWFVTPTGRPAMVLAVAIISGAIVVAYANSLSAPFIFDDIPAIVNNPTIRDLGRLTDVLAPPNDGSSVTARPLVNLTFALNHAIGGLDVRGYHAFNLAVHLLAALALFDLAGRTLRRPVFAAQVRAAAWPIAFWTALLWGVHPLQSEAVTCVVHRTESLAGLFYLLTLGCFMRAIESRRPALWIVASVVACLAGMAAKEVMVTAPLMVLLFDRTFAAGTFREALRLRWRWHAALALTWVLLGYLVVNSGGQRGSSAGLGLGVTAWQYALTQCRAIVHYLRLAFWPEPLVVDYGTGVVTSVHEVAVPVAVTVLLVVATIVALFRRPVVGFIGAWFFGILAPSSSVLPVITQTMAERRMYLPLVAVLIPVVLGLGRRSGRYLPGVCAVVAIGAVAGTMRRNRDYRDELHLWQVTVADCPTSARAHANLGVVLYDRGRTDEAIVHYREALEIEPRFANAHYNLGIALEAVGRREEATAEYTAAVHYFPSSAPARIALGRILRQLGRSGEAVGQFQEAARLAPARAEVEGNWGAALFDTGDLAGALEHLERAARLDPAHADVQFNLGLALVALARDGDALVHFATAVRLKPDHAEARLNHGIALARQGALSEALEQFTHAARLRPDLGDAHRNRANVLLELQRFAEAAAAYREALRLRPDDVEAHVQLAHALLALGEVDDARRHLEWAVRLAPDFGPAVELLRRLAGAP